MPWHKDICTVYTFAQICSQSANIWISWICYWGERNVSKMPECKLRPNSGEVVRCHATGREGWWLTDTTHALKSHPSPQHPRDKEYETAAITGLWRLRFMSIGCRLLERMITQTVPNWTSQSLTASIKLPTSAHKKSIFAHHHWGRLRGFWAS